MPGIDYGSMATGIRRRLEKAFELTKAYASLRTFPRHGDAPRHSLPAPLIISLTSYPGRFATLHLTLKSLLDQTVKPDHVLLWIAHQDAAQVPEDVRALERFGLTIRYCDDIRSFKKIIPTLEEHRDAFIITVDDDTFYPDTWLEKLVGAYDVDQPSVVCYRAHRIAYAADGSLAPYHSWQVDVMDEATLVPSRDLLPTGNGGVMYPPGALHADTTDMTMVRKLSRTSDDVWLFFMWHRSGWSVRRVPGGKFDPAVWRGSQTESLFALHKGGLKDEHLKDMANFYGVP